MSIQELSTALGLKINFNQAIFNSSDVVWPKFSFKKLIPLNEQILKFLENSGNIGKTRSQVCKAVNAPRTTVYDTIQRMVHKNIIEVDYRHFKGKRGRPQTLFYLKGQQQGNRR
ncbi:MAG: hypothetical protein ACXAC7_02155 [Candidatus Hodarchaeales archaeon]|jgi:hypothetical protein